MFAWRGLLVRPDHARSSVTLAPHWRHGRQCRRNGRHNFIMDTLSCLPCSTDAAKSAPVKPNAGGSEDIH
eukprot:8273777-Pyramimonas_sp.AAC.2